MVTIICKDCGKQVDSYASKDRGGVYKSICPACTAIRDTTLPKQEDDVVVARRTIDDPEPTAPVMSKSMQRRLKIQREAKEAREKK